MVSFAWWEHISEKEAWRLAYYIAGYYADRYQIVYAVHENKPEAHIHFVFNPVSFVDGHIYAEGKDDFAGLRDHICWEMNIIKNRWRTEGAKPEHFLVNRKYIR